MKYLEIILNSDVFQSVHMIGIIGSVGRREKAITDENLNDVDFLVIAEDCCYEEKVKLERILNRELGTLFTDVLFLTPSTVRKKFLGNGSFPQSYFDIINDLDAMWMSERGTELKEIIKNCKKRPSIDSGVALIVTRFNVINDEEMKKCTDLNYQYGKNVKALIDGYNLIQKTYKQGSHEDKVSNLKGKQLQQFLSTSLYCELENVAPCTFREKVILLHKDYLKVLLRSEMRSFLLFAYASLIFTCKTMAQRNWGMLSKIFFYVRRTLS